MNDRDLMRDLVEEAYEAGCESASEAIGWLIGRGYISEFWSVLGRRYVLTPLGRDYATYGGNS